MSDNGLDVKDMRVETDTEQTDEAFLSEGLVQAEEKANLFRVAKKTFSRIGWAYFTFLVVGILSQTLVALIYGRYMEASGAEIKNPLVLQLLDYMIVFLPMYGIGIPVLMKVLRPLPIQERKGESFGFFRLLKLFVISIPVMYLGNMIGLGIADFIGEITGKNPVNRLSELITNTNPLMNLLFVVILAPIIEEVLFRKFILDRTVAFGEKNAIILSALMFGLFHMNFYQFFYATALGAIFGYIYVKSGKLRYTVILHMLINFMGSILSVFLTEEDSYILKIMQEGNFENLSADILTRVIIISLYFLFMIVVCIIGIILMLMNIRKVKLDEGGLWTEKRKLRSLTYGNLGIAFFIALCLVMTYSTMMSQLQ